MSGIVAVFQRDGRPAEAGEARRLVARLGHRGPDGSAVWTSGPLALGYCRLTTMPEAEEQPLAAAGLAITFDGRIDNREALAAAFARAGVEVAGPSDAAYALAAYQVWG